MNSSPSDSRTTRVARSIPLWLPLPIAFGMVLTTLLIWQTLSLRDQERLTQAIRLEAETVRKDVRHPRSFVGRQDEQQAAWQWLRQADPEDERWKAGAALYAKVRLACRGVAWMDSSLRVRWVVPSEHNESFQGLDLSRDSRQRTVLEEARAQRGFRFLHCMTFPDGGKAMLDCRPLFRDQTFSGFLLCIYRPDEYWGENFRNVPPHWGVAISDGPDMVYLRDDRSDPEAERWGVEQEFLFYGMKWRVRHWPDAALVAKETSPLPRLVLVVGCLLGFLVPGMVSLAQQAVLRARLAEGANRELCNQVEERQRAEEAVRESEARYRLLFESNPLPMWVCDSETLAFLAVNAAAIAHYGYSREQFLALTIKDIHLAEDVPILLKTSALPPQTLEGTSAQRHRKKDGTVIDVEVTSHELSFAGRRAQLVLAKDVTERKRLEEQFRHAQKMEAIGRLAGGVAHDMNNMLTVINGYSNLLREEMAPEEPSRHLLEEIRRAGERCTSICRQLLAYSRKQVLAPRVLDLNGLVRGAERMLSRLLGEDVEFATVTDPMLDRVRADPGQIEQILMNLAVNALDAMPKGGRLTIRTANVVLDETSRHEHADVVPGPYVLLSVADTGCGMSEEVQARIFEPFFTTKEVGKGTGLGLATVYGIVKQTGGYIQVKSAVGQGTTFNTYLPAHREPAESAEPARTEAVLPVTTEGSEMVLVAEDEDSLRRMIGFALRQQGYTVVEARNGPDALRKSQELSRPLDLLVTDVAMPQMSGRELAQQLTGRFPGVKVLYISGYTDDVVLRHGLEEAKVNFLHKPFPLTVLAQKVREVLDSAPSIAGVFEVSPVAQS